MTRRYALLQGVVSLAIVIMFGINAMRFKQIAEDATVLAKQAAALAAECTDELTLKIIGPKAEWCAKCDASEATSCIYREVTFWTWSLIDECGRDQRIEMDGSAVWR